MRSSPSIAALVFLIACDDAAPQPAPEVRGKPIASAPQAKATGPAAATTATTTSPIPEVRALTGQSTVNLAAEAPPADPPKLVDGFREVRFELLTSYDYEWSQTTGVAAPVADQSARIPAAVKELDGQKTFVVGYMQPIDFDTSGVKSFLLTNYPGGCCFGMVPRLNEWIEVEMPGDERVDYSYFDPIKIQGVLEVGEAKSGEVVTSLYRMRPEKVAIVEQ